MRSDNDIKQDVEAELKWSPDVDGFAMGATADRRRAFFKDAVTSNFRA